MNLFFLQFLDWLFLLFHLSLVIFNLFGWIWKKTRCWNLIALLLTFSSWFLLGLIYGIGFCPFTEWHWQILYKLGHTGLPDSYVSYLVIRTTGIDPPQYLIDQVTVIGAFTAFFISLVLSIRDRVRKK
jgi:hypothetical protein